MEKLYKVLIFNFFHQNCTIVKFVYFEYIFKIIGTFLKLCHYVFKDKPFFNLEFLWVSKNKTTLLYSKYFIYTLSITQSASKLKKIAEVSINFILYCFKLTIWWPDKIWNCKIGWAIAKLKWPKEVYECSYLVTSLVNPSGNRHSWRPMVLIVDNTELVGRVFIITLQTWHLFIHSLRVKFNNKQRAIKYLCNNSWDTVKI